MNERITHGPGGLTVVRTPFIASGVVLMAVCCVILAAGAACNSLLYYPSAKEYGSPPAHAPKELRIGSASGNSLHGWFFPALNGTPRGLFLFFHGNARNISAHYRAFLWLTEHGYDYALFDYSGYGKSSGRAGTTAIHLDGVSIIDTAIESFDRGPGYKIIVGGQSLGGAVVLDAVAHANRRERIDLVFVDCAFASYRRIAAYHARAYCTPMGPLVALLVSDRYAPERRLDRLKDIPVLVSHCREDRSVPYEFGTDLFLRMGPKATLVTINCRHTAGYWDERNRIMLLQFFERLCPPIVRAPSRSRSALSAD